MKITVFISDELTRDEHFVSDRGVVKLARKYQLITVRYVDQVMIIWVANFKDTLSISVHVTYFSHGHINILFVVSLCISTKWNRSQNLNFIDRLRTVTTEHLE